MFPLDQKDVSSLDEDFSRRVSWVFESVRYESDYCKLTIVDPFYDPSYLVVIEALCPWCISGLRFSVKTLGDGTRTYSFGTTR